MTNPLVKNKNKLVINVPEALQRSGVLGRRPPGRRRRPARAREADHGREDRLEHRPTCRPRKIATRVTSNYKRHSHRLTLMKRFFLS